MSVVFGPLLFGFAGVLTLAFAWRVVRSITNDVVPGRQSVTQPWMLAAMFASYPFNWIAIWAIGYYPWKWLA